MLSMMKALKVSALSAIGSMIRPKSVMRSCERAMCPSSWSVTPAITNTLTAHQCRFQSCCSIKMMRMGTMMK